MTPLSVAALAGEKALHELFDRDDEAEIGHIRLSREADWWWWRRRRRT